MTSERVEEKVRETLHAVALDRVRAPGDLAERVVRRRGRRRFAQAAGAAMAVAAIGVGTVFGLGGGGAVDQDRPVRPAVSPEGWQPWRSDGDGAAERGCLVDGSALYCAGSEYDAAKFDANTGERLWTVEVNGEGNGPDHPFAVRDGVLYGYRNHTADKQPNGDYAGGTDLMAVNTDTGKRLWSVEMAHDNRDDQSALLIDGAILANTPTDRTMTALDPLTGAEKWRHTWGKGIWCDRAVLSGVPYLLCTPETKKSGDTDVFRLDPVTGSAEKVTTLPGRHQIAGTLEDRLVLMASADADSPTSGDLLLTLLDGTGERISHPYRIDGPVANSDVIGDLLITVDWTGEVTAHSLTTAKTLWSSPVGFEMPDQDSVDGIATPVVSEEQGVVYFLNPAGDLSGLALGTGERVWRGHVDLGASGSGGYGGRPQLLLYGDALIAGEGGRLVSVLPRIAD
ncbi:PQQ-binding-like beta-propeller repeat protein [Streptomyces phaeolivaceus]|uniref:PQQ-binding-like beta-propeller repeat protein n=1 Tax=Streptomyces phaeolivaceus TaxID=2653200 RepID=A0A5P8JXP0_9ACTN|nr:PQQ-binding-like beta-propeller repeat protein [Streptomyces phaeolivaceus]QFQ95262.1 PQQ-binding-like beta-propeller repeat protein [Streptomyces phaeolivaceus]